MKFSFVRIDKSKALHLTVKTAEWFFERIKTDTKAADVGKLRQHIAAFGEVGGYEQRNPLTHVYPAVELQKEKNGNLTILQFNALITLHVGGLLRSQDLEAVKEASGMLPMTLGAFVGADGRSVEILVAVGLKEERTLQNEPQMDSFCQLAYDVAFGVYSGVLPKPIERQSVTARTSFVLPLDAHPYVNLSATPLLIDGSRIMLENMPEKPENEQTETDLELYGDYEHMYQRAAVEAREATADVAEDQKQNAYLTELTRRLCDMGVPEEEAFLHIRNHHVYSRRFDEYTVRAIVSATYAENRPFVSLAGSEHVGQETRRLIHFLTTRYVFRYNKVMGYVEYRPNNTWIHQWAPCDENAVNGLTIEARLANYDVRDKDVRRYVHSNLVRTVNPIDDFLWHVHNKWDGKTDHIALLARRVKCEVPQWERWFRKWFLAMVAQWRGLTGDFGNAIVPLLISSQGDGKSTFCLNILPPELRWGYLPNLDVAEKRQTLLAMHNFLLINLDEFNQISPKVQEGFLKNVIQLPSVKIKRPYGRHVEDFPRMASFIATTNDDRVLSDPTGNRRFICVRLSGPVDNAAKPNYEQLYSQAWQLLDRGEQFWFGADDVQQVMAHNREFEQAPPAVQYFLDYYDIVGDESEGEWLTATAIFDVLRRKAGSGLKVTAVSRFGRYLSNMPGLQQRRSRKGREYLVRQRM